MQDEAKNAGGTVQGIRGYGPGKFDTIVDSYVYHVTLEGVDSEVGDVQDMGWFGVMGGKDLLAAVERAASEEGDKLTPEEKELFKDDGGVIISEDGQGFVSVDYFNTKAELDQKWSEIEDEAETFYTDNPDDSDEALDELSGELDKLTEKISSLNGESMCEAKKSRRAKKNKRGRKGKPSPRRGKRKH
jgi:chaperonin cofactor prefoldin